MENRELNTISWKKLLTVIGIYSILVLYIQSNSHSSPRPFYAVLEEIFSPINFISLFLPILSIILSYELTSRYWFSQVKSWALIREKKEKNFLKEELKGILKLDFFYTFGAWIVAQILLYIWNTLNNTKIILPDTGVGKVYGMGTGTAILLVAVYFINLMYMLLPVCLNFFVKKKWMVLINSIIIELLLPIILFTVDLLPEKYLPINALNQFLLVQKQNINQLFIPIVLIGGVIFAESILIFIGSKKLNWRVK